MRNATWITFLMLATLIGCQHQVKHEVTTPEPVQVEVKPIHITVDVNVKIDRQLDEFFDFEDEPALGSTPESRN